MKGLDETKTCHYCDKEKVISNWNACKDCLDKSGVYIKIIEKGWDHRDYQGLFEVCNTQDWARELNKLGHSIPIPKIRENRDKKCERDDPPDVLAEMDGEKIAVEVRRLFVYRKGNKELADRVYYGEEQVPDEDKKKKFVEELKQKHAKELEWPIGVEWTRETFQKYLKEIVQEKDGKMKYGKKGRDGSLCKQFLLIVTHEVHLGEDILDDYLKTTILPRPKNFDAVYVMGAHVPNFGKGHYPVFEVCLSDSHHQ